MPNRPPLPLAQQMRDMAADLSAMATAQLHDPETPFAPNKDFAKENAEEADVLREAAAVLDALYDALVGIEYEGEARACPMCACEPHDVDCEVYLALARARQAVP